MPLARRYDETEVLDRAMHAFWSRGYEATSVGDLVAATGIHRASLYAAFSGKRQLFVECLRRYDEEHRERFLAGIAGNRTPRAAILATFDAASRKSDDPATPTGCLLVNTALEVSPHDPEIRALVNESLAAVEAFFHRNVAAGVSQGSIREDADPDATAKALLGLFLGLRVLTRSGIDPATIGAVLEQAAAILGPEAPSQQEHQEVGQ